MINKPIYRLRIRDFNLKLSSDNILSTYIIDKFRPSPTKWIKKNYILLGQLYDLSYWN